MLSLVEHVIDVAIQKRKLIIGIRYGNAAAQASCFDFQSRSTYRGNPPLKLLAE